MKIKDLNFREFAAVLLLFAVHVGALPAFGQQRPNRQLQQIESAADGEKRIALVIGNGNYTTARKLANPVNDATDVTAALRGLGFEIISGTDLNLAQMSAKVREFGDKLRQPNAVGLFYYAGHGVQAGGRNYLIPVNANIEREDEIGFNALNLDQVLIKMGTANNGLNIVVLDACRNNPFARSWSRSAEEGGLANITAPTGTFIAYATAPNDTADDGRGRNGLYTGELLKFIKQPNLKIEEAFKEVTKAVDRVSGGKQIPWVSSSLRGEFYFKIDKPTVVKKPIDTSEPDFGATTDAKTIEREAFRAIQTSTDAAEIRAVLEEYPNSQFAAGAKTRLEQITWAAIKDSPDKTKFQSYLTDFPNGANAPLARIKIRQLEAAATIKTTPPISNAPINNSAAPLNNSANNAAARPAAGAISKSKLPNGAEMSFAYIPAGEFQMGSNMRNEEKPVHTVKISQGFWIGQTEVTQRQWKAVMGELPSQCDSGELKGEFVGDNKPIICVSWNDAQEFVRQLNGKNDGYKYRLPTEAEWEYAARAGTTGNYAGNLDSMGWFWENSGDQRLSGELNYEKLKANNNRTHLVGQKQSNAWNLYDMHGNVWEWCEDWYDENYYSKSPSTDPMGASSGSGRMYRGGGWGGSAMNLRSAFRDGIPPSYRNVSLGFRVVRTAL